MNIYIYSNRSSHSSKDIIDYIELKLKDIFNDLIVVPYDSIDTVNFVNVNTLIFSGGDGVFNNLVNKLSNFNIIFAYIPTGTANDMGHNLNIKNVNKALDAIENKNIIKLNLLELNSDVNKYFLYAFSIGEMSKIANNAKTRSKKRLGKFLYIFRGCLYLFAKREKINYKIDEKNYEKRLRCLIITRSKYLGGVRIEKNFQNELHVYPIRNIFDLGFLFILKRGKFIKANNIEFCSNSCMSIDGENINLTSGNIKISDKYISIYKNN